MRTRLLLVLFLVATPPAALAQRAAPPRSPSASPEAGAITPGEVQRMFDAWALVQAQDALSLSEDQYGRFATRLKALQDTRRRHMQARQQIGADLRRALNGQAA